MALVGIVALVLVRVLCPTDPPRDQAPLGYRASYARVLGDRSAVLLLAVTFVWFIAPMGLFVYIAEFMHVTHGVPTSQAGLALIAVGLVGVVASRLSGRFMAVLGPRTAVLGAIAVFGTAMLLMPFTSSSLALSLLVLGLWASGTWFGVPAHQAIVSAHSDRLRGTMLAFNSSALNLAGVVGPVVIGSIVDGRRVRARVPDGRRARCGHVRDRLARASAARGGAAGGGDPGVTAPDAAHAAHGTDRLRRLCREARRGRAGRGTRRPGGAAGARRSCSRG